MRFYKSVYKIDPTSFLLLGQKLNDDQIVAEKNLDPNAPLGDRLLVNHRRLIGILIPFVAFQVSNGAIMNRSATLGSGSGLFGELGSARAHGDRTNLRILCLKEI